MKTTALLAFAFAGLFALNSNAADASDEVKAAAKKLAESPNYSWTSKTDSPQARAGRGPGFFGAATPSGMTEKDGFTLLTYKMGENTTDVVRKGRKASVKSGDEWLTTDELKDNTDSAGGGGPGGPGNRMQFLVRRALQFKMPAAAALELMDRVKTLSKDGDAYAGELTPEGIKQMFTFRGRPGPGGGRGNGPDTSGLKGTAKFWINDGLLSKYEQHVEGKMSGGGRRGGGADINRTTTVEIKDVGSTKVVVAPEARKKLNAN